MTRTLVKILASAALATMAVSALATAANAADPVRDKWCSSVHLRFFVGGAEGDAFGTIVYNGAKQAEHDLGANVEYLFSGWKAETMVQQLREAIAAKPDGIAMMGHPGEAAVMPLAEQAFKAGIKMMYQNVPLPGVVAKYGGGYVGAQQAAQGKSLGEEAIRRFGLQKGDEVIVLGPFDQQPERYVREGSVAQAFEDAGLTVYKLVAGAELAADPNIMIPVITAALAAHPKVKLVAYPGGQQLGNVPTFMKAAGKKPGEVLAIGFDTSPQIVRGLQGWLGAAHRGPAALPAGLHADPQPVPAGRLSAWLR